jgi:hypothetical protein
MTIFFTPPFRIVAVVAVVVAAAAVVAVVAELPLAAILTPPDAPAPRAEERTGFFFTLTLTRTAGSNPPPITITGADAAAAPRTTAPALTTTCPSLLDTFPTATLTTPVLFTPPTSSSRRAFIVFVAIFSVTVGDALLVRDLRLSLSHGFGVRPVLDSSGGGLSAVAILLSCARARRVSRCVEQQPDTLFAREPFHLIFPRLALSTFDRKKEKVKKRKARRAA